MPKRQRSRRGVQERLSRTFEVTSLELRVGYAAVSPRREEPYAESHLWLVVHGTLDEPVKDVREVQVHTYPKDHIEIGTARPASVGSIIQVKPYVSVVAPLPNLEFDRVWALAIGGLLKYGHVSFTKPHYGRALVTSFSLSNTREE